MKSVLIYILLLVFVFSKGDDHFSLPAKQTVVSKDVLYQHDNISGSTHKRSPVDLFASTACCDDDDDVNEPVKKKTGSTVSFFLSDVLKEIFVYSELKQAQHVSKCFAYNSEPAYILQRELLI